MPAKTARSKATVARVTPLDQATLLSRFGEKDRGSFDRQIQTYATKIGPEPARRWQHIASVLMTMAMGPAKIGPGHTIQFFIPDGKYRKQVFALAGGIDGALSVYAPDVLAEAIRAGVLSKPKKPESPDHYLLPDSGETLMIECLDSKTPNPEASYKDMTGWNRKAIRVTLSASPTDAQLLATELICAVAAATWAGTAAATPAK